MKRITIFSLIAMSMLFAIILVINPRPATGSANQAPSAPGTALPDSIKAFVQKTCMDCHADNGSFMAKGKVNFSVWESYDAEKQVNKAKAICKELAKGSMPPGKWCKNNPGAVPTQAQVNMVCHWANSLQK
jgi:hypothetical protein